MSSTILPPNLKFLFDQMVRGNSEDISAYLTTVASSIALPNTNASIHCHSIALDGQNFPRVRDLARFLAQRILDYSIPRSQIDRAMKHMQSTGSTSKFIELEKKAASLFTDLEKSGEGGELLLYLLVEYFLKLPQVMCKMPLKTSGEVHYHGIDGIHASTEPATGKLALYWGESKLYKDAHAAMRECIASIKPFLLPHGGTGDPRERDLQLMRDNLDLNNPALEAALLKYLNPDDSHYKQLEYRGACLIGFDHSSYPNIPHSKTEEQVCAEIRDEFASWLDSLEKKTVDASIHSFVLEVFLVPFPSVEQFRAAFAEEIGIRAPS